MGFVLAGAAGDASLPLRKGHLEFAQRKGLPDHHLALRTFIAAAAALALRRAHHELSGWHHHHLGAPRAVTKNACAAILIRGLLLGVYLRRPKQQCCQCEKRANHQLSVVPPPPTVDRRHAWPAAPKIDRVAASKPTPFSDAHHGVARTVGTLLWCTSIFSGTPLEHLRNSVASVDPTRLLASPRDSPRQPRLKPAANAGANHSPCWQATSAEKRPAGIAGAGTNRKPSRQLGPSARPAPTARASLTNSPSAHQPLPVPSGGVPRAKTTWSAAKRAEGGRRCQAEHVPSGRRLAELAS